MTTIAARGKAGIVRGLPYVGALFALVAIGCGADASTDPSAEQTDDLRWGRGHGHHWGPKLCRSAEGSECRDDQLCLPLLSRACPGPRHVGICVPKPRMCPDVSDPVCGCDGVTYDNLCEAAAARTAIEHTGACAPTGGCGSTGVCPGSGTCGGGGACECTVVQQCERGMIWSSDPAVCACVIDPTQQDPCARVQCPTGMACVVQSDGSVACQ